VREDLAHHPGWCENLIRAGSLEPGERVLVVVDEPLVEEGSQLVAAVRDAGGKPRLELWSGAAPPIAPGREADLSLFLAQEPKGDEAGARLRLMQSVTQHGGRQLFLGFVDGELLRGDLSQPPADVTESARRVLAQLDGADELHLTGAAGTDLRLRAGGRDWRTDAKRLGPGDTANFPSGEVFVAPLEDSADGVLVADLTVPYTVPGLVDAPVTLRFERGRVVSIEGGRAAQMLRELVADAGNGADVIAELGVGLNPAVKPRGHVMLDEKAARTAHVAIGGNAGHGGVNEAAIHVDCVFSGPQLEVDGRRVELG
jgi:aminopeptidase